MNTNEQSKIILPQVHGSTKLKKALNALCHEYKDIFSSTLTATPAHVNPLVLTVDETKWLTKRNKAPARLQTPTKSQEVYDQIQKMQKAGIIRPSQAEAYSQVLLTPKPNNKWRFCIDFRSLNAATTSMVGQYLIYPQC